MSLQLRWTPAAFRSWMSGMMTLYWLLLIGAILVIKHHPPSGLARYLVAVAPAAPLIGVIAINGRRLAAESDEFLRGLWARAMLWALGTTLTATTVWGFLEEGAGAPHVALYWVFPFFCLCMVVAQPILALRYR